MSDEFQSTRPRENPQPLGQAHLDFLELLNNQTFAGAVVNHPNVKSLLEGIASNEYHKGPSRTHLLHRPGVRSH